LLTQHGLNEEENRVKTRKDPFLPVQIDKLVPSLAIIHHKKLQKMKYKGAGTTITTTLRPGEEKTDKEYHDPTPICCKVPTHSLPVENKAHQQLQLKRKSPYQSPHLKPYPSNPENFM
jgi:hypothetical protein